MISPICSSLVVKMVGNLPAMKETWVWSLCEEDSLEKGIATHSSILAWRIPWTEEPGGLQSVGLQRVRQDWMTFTFRGELYLTMDSREFVVYCSVKVYRILELGGTFKILLPSLLLAESLNWVYFVDYLIELDLQVWLAKYLIPSRLLQHKAICSLIAQL